MQVTNAAECEECLTGSAACTGKNNTVTLNTTTVCCADADTVPDAQQSAEGVVNCTCVYRDPGKSLEELIQAWAKATDSLGRLSILSEASLPLCVGGGGMFVCAYSFTLT